MIKKGLHFLSRNYRYCAPDNLCNVVISLCFDFENADWTSPQTIVTWRRNEQNSRPQRKTKYVVPRAVS